MPLPAGTRQIDFDDADLLDIFRPGGGEFTGPGKRTISGRPCKLYRNLGNGRFSS